MIDSKVPVPSSFNTPTVKFESNVDFQRHDPTQDSDSSFMKYTTKSWMQQKGEHRVNREVIATLLASQGGENVDECIDKLLAEEISYRDLGSLTQPDLQLMGFKNCKQREELLTFLQMLPNQDPSYDGILKLPEAKNYNRNILNSTTAHLEMMRSALSAANYKLKIMPTEDVVVGEKSFASRFVLEALSELKGVTDEIDVELQELSKLVTDEKRSQIEPQTVSRISPGSWIFLSSAATGALAAIWFWKFSK